MKNFLNKRIGTFVPIHKRTKLIHEFTGITIRMWFFIPFRIATMFPLMILGYVGSTINEWCTKGIDFIDRKFV